ncbi:G-patch domain protein [Drechmeria coniospora]|uniref:G-patch domain protein n=1 Tax=Drechmeria coniospora TaxID=98403 RepID=A0A151GPN3_DRECN|nr:G-patch domain protein [Drechmeria coniospora]KYK59067.1 G-patch domain protein [Drechmeria coniospora]
MRRTREQDDEDDDIPLHRKKPFGAGLKRKRVEFVPATDADSGISPSGSAAADKGLAIGDLYARVVLGNRSASGSGSVSGTDAQAATAGVELASVCSVCSLPITTSIRQHEASLAHQVSLAHSHPPSGLDRSRMGLRALQLQGWDPDARRGLGAEGDGLRFPIKVAAKDDQLGIGAASQAPNKADGKQDVSQARRQMSAKERKALALQERQKADRLQAEMYGSLDVESILRGNGADNDI